MAGDKKFVDNPRMVDRQLPPTSKEAIAQRLIATRGALGLTQAAFGRRCGIAPQTLNNYEQAINRISIEQALMICQATGATLDWIYRGEMAGLPLMIVEGIQKKQQQKGTKRA